MDKIVAAINLDHPVISTAPAVESLSRFERLKDDSSRLIGAIVHAKSGRVVGNYDSATIVELPVASSDALKEIRQRIRREIGIPLVSIGVGEDIDQAMVALDKAKQDNAIRIYRPEMAEDTVQPASVAFGEETEPVRKAEISEDSKKIVADLLANIQGNKEYVEQLKQVNPPAYGAIVEAVQAISSMMAHVKATHEESKKQSEKEQLDKIAEAAHGDTLDHDEQKVLAELVEQVARGHEAEVLQRSESPEFANAIAGVIKRLHSAIPHFERIRQENPPVFATFVKLVRVLDAFHKHHASFEDMPEGEEEEQQEAAPAAGAPTHVRPPPKDEPITHPKPVYAPGSIREYSPQNARQKTTDGDWVSVTGGQKRVE